MESKDAKTALLRLIQKGPEFSIPESMAGKLAAGAADVQYQTWVNVYIIPILSSVLYTGGGDTITGTIGSDSSDNTVGKEITRFGGLFGGLFGGW